MKLLFVADGRSPIALNWIGYFIELGHEVHLASTFPVHPDLAFSSVEITPVAFSGAKVKDTPANAGKVTHGYVWSASFIGIRTRLRHWLGPFTLRKAARRLGEVIKRVQPDLIHAMRIPYEGMLAATCLAGKGGDFPLIISVWGNDFTLHAPASPWMRLYTRQALAHASGLHTDCWRDLRLARIWGFPQDRPYIVLPGAGGIQLEIFHPDPSQGDQQARDGTLPVVVNPRGFRAYVRNDTFFRSIPLVLERFPKARFLCPGMAGEKQALRWLKRLHIHGSVELLPHLKRSEMADLFRKAQVAVSPTIHDGTPNTLLEAMACGCFPIAGDLESIREWITPGVNGLLVDPGEPQALAERMIQALENPALRRQAAQYNLELVAARAEYRKVMGEAARFYKRVIRRSESDEK